MSLGKRLGVSVQKLFEWARLDPNLNQANDIVKTAKAKYDEEQWSAVAKPLNDSLRESQRGSFGCLFIDD